MRHGHNIDIVCRHEVVCGTTQSREDWRGHSAPVEGGTDEGGGFLAATLWT